VADGKPTQSKLIMSKIYLAIPYSFNPEHSFYVANKMAAQLMEAGHVVFSPISHSHPISKFLPAELKIDSLWWMDQDLPFIVESEEVYVVVIGAMGHQLIAESKGVQMEMEFAKKCKKKIILIDYYD
jgi:nucleoside 2-deoxyribosyltransferase